MSDLVSRIRQLEAALTELQKRLDDSAGELPEEPQTFLNGPDGDTWVRWTYYDALRTAATEKIAALKAENEALRKDAERLNWLEDRSRCYWVSVQGQPAGNVIRSGQGEGLREAIDAAKGSQP